MSRREHNWKARVIAPRIAYKGAAGNTRTSLSQTLQRDNMSVSRLNDSNVALLAVNMTSQPITRSACFFGTNIAALGLPQGQGGRSMIVVLPNTSVNFDTFIGTLTAADPFLPRFATSFATGGCLPSARSAPWREVAFQPYSGDFSERHPSAHLSGVQHDTVVQVDETVPVATGSTTVKGSVPAVARQSVNPEVDHPFFYTIRDNQTGASLFAGVMTNPNAG